MNNAFSLILNMSLTGSVVIALVLLGRLALRRQPKIFSYALWAVVLFRLLCPVSISAPVSALEVARPEVTQSSPAVSRVSFVAAEPTAVTVAKPTAPAAQKAKAEPMTIAAWVWLAGLVGLGAYSLASYAFLRGKLVGSVPMEDGVYLSDHVDTPFVMGLVSPKIYLPADTPPEQWRFILAHEQHHIRRRDHIWKLLAYLALCLHWFNPLVWLSFVLAGKDMEMSCDEAVIRRLGEHTRADYCTALLRLSTKRTIIRGTPLAFGEGDTKGRVINMAKWKKPKVWASLVCAAVCIALLAACAVNPAKETPAETTPETSLETTPAVAPEAAAESGTYRQPQELPLPEGYVFVNQELMTEEESMKTSDQPHSVVGGLVCYDIPDDLERDPNFRWLESIGFPDATDPTLAQVGGSGDYCDWLLEVFSDVPQGQPQTVHRYHELTVLVDEENGHATLYDVWFDATQIDYQQFAGFLTFPEIPAPEADTGEQEAFQRCMEVIANVGARSHQLHAEAQGPGGSTTIVEEYKIHNGDCLHIEQVDGSYQEAILVVGEQYFYGTGDIGGEIAWKSITTEEYAQLHMQRFWLGHSTLTESHGATYVGTMNESQGPQYIYRFDDIYASSRWPVAEESGSGKYQVDLQFDQDGNFLWAQIGANLTMENEVRTKESIVTLDETAIRAAIDREYQKATQGG